MESIDNNISSSLIDNEQALSFIEKDINSIGSSRFKRLAVVSEVIRQNVNNIYDYRCAWGAQKKIHTRTLAQTVKNKLGYIWPELLDTSYDSGEENVDDKDNVSSIVHKLGAIGDIASVENGHWLPSPLRIISIPNSNVALIIGSVSNTETQNYIGVAPELHGTARVIRLDSKSVHVKKIQDEILNLDAWLGLANADIMEWTKEVLEVLKGKMPKAEKSITTNLEVYAPDLKRKAQNWIPLSELTEKPSGLRICRTPFDANKLYDRPIFIVELKKSYKKIVITKSQIIPKEIYKRLIYGVDLMLNNPIPAEIISSGDSINVGLSRYLPSPENKIEHYALSRSSLGEKYLEFPKELEILVITVLKRLGIRIIYKITTREL